MVGRLVRWFLGWLVGQLAGWLAGWLVGWLAGWLVGLERTLHIIYYLQLVDLCRYLGTYVAVPNISCTYLFSGCSVAIANNINLALLSLNTHLSNGVYRGTATANGNE